MPFSEEYDDVYFSIEHGLEESRHVFLNGNQLTRRWAGQKRHVIGETGFGTGLNFLATWQAWQNDSARCDTLHFISIEKHPLDVEALRRCHAAFPELASLSKQLVDGYPFATAGVHRIWLDQHRVCLTLYLMDVTDAFNEMTATADSWFLDGFAPSKNPAMWTTPVFRHLARLSRPDTSLATFTAAGHVRRGLHAAGFEIQKQNGFGRKREMVTGRLTAVPTIRVHEPWRQIHKQPDAPSKATVIGAGIAGAQIAWHLAQRGVEVALLEQHSAPGLEASASPKGIVAPRLGAKPSIEESFVVSAYLATLRQLQSLNPGAANWSQCGVLYLATSERKKQQVEAISQRELPVDLVQCVSKDRASTIAGVTVPAKGLYFPKGGWIRPREIIQLLLSHPLIDTRYGHAIDTIKQCDDGWQLTTASGQSCHSNCVILANGSGLSDLLPMTAPLDRVVGQTSLMQATPDSDKLRAILQHDGYIIPATDGEHLIGATHQRPDQPALSEEQINLQNRDNVDAALPSLAAACSAARTGHTGVRMTTKTRFPLIGNVPDQNFFDTGNGDSAYLPGLYVTGALGSRGLTTAALSAETLASEIMGEPGPLGRSLRRATEPVKWVY